MRKVTVVALLLCVVACSAASQTQQISPTGLRLSLKHAVEIALAPDGNARVRLAEESTRQAEARSAQARAALLPDVEASFSAQSKTLNLGLLGLPTVPGFLFPPFVGPFSIWDARAAVSQSIFDLSSVRRFQASRMGVEASRMESESARDQVAAQVARLYLTTLRAETALETAQANVALAEELLQLAQERLNAGTGTGIEVTRARVQMAHEQQALLSAETERRRARLQLLKALNLNLQTTLELTDRMAMLPGPVASWKEALTAALQSRADLKALERREENARLSHRAANAERLPSLVGFADYGSFGSGLQTVLPTRAYGLSLRIPLFNGGAREARGAESLSQWRQETIRKNDLRQQVELEVRQAFDNLRSAEAQVKLAEEELALAESEVAQARRRYEAGLAGSLEITEAQTRLARARDSRIAALFSYNQARIDLSAAMGTTRSTI